MYPWPFGEFDNAMDEALDIAMDYLIRTNRAINFREVQTSAANAIADAWRAGVRSRMRLTNVAIKASNKARSAHMPIAVSKASAMLTHRSWQDILSTERKFPGHCFGWHGIGGETYFRIHLNGTLATALMTGVATLKRRPRPGPMRTPLRPCTGTAMAGIQTRRGRCPQ
jgi:hypothetical protein